MAKKAKKQVKKPTPYRARHTFGILNPWGNFWTWKTFESEARARAYVEAYWAKNRGARAKEYKIVRARVTVSMVPQ